MATKIRRPPLTQKTLSGLLELVAFAEDKGPVEMLGGDPFAWEGTPQGAEMMQRWEAIMAACKWIENLREYKAKKTKA